MKKIALLLLLIPFLVFGQTYEGAAGRTWIVNTTGGDKIIRDYGTADAAGNYPWTHYSLYKNDGTRTSSLLSKPNFRAARVIVSDTATTYAQRSDGTCFVFKPDSSESIISCPPITPPPPTPPPVTPPVPPVTPPPPVLIPCDLSTAKEIRVAVVPLAYQTYPEGSSKESRDAYYATIPRITQVALRAILSPVTDWWVKVSYCTQRLTFNVLPEVSLPGNPGCDATRAWNDAATAARGTSYDLLLGVSPYGCWRSQGVGGPGGFIAWNTHSGGAGLYAHEFGHGLGLWHNGSKMPGYAEYGSGLDQLGAGSDFYTLRNLSAYHKIRLGMLAPKSCASSTLRSIVDYPDSIQCGQWHLYYAESWRNEVVVSKQEFTPGGGGGSDVTDYAYLKPGQSYKMDSGQTVKHEGGGKVMIAP